MLHCGQYYTFTPVFAACVRAHCFIEYARHCFSIGDTTLGGTHLAKLSKMPPQRRSNRKHISVTIVTFCCMVIYQCVVLCIWTFYNDNKYNNNYKTVSTIAATTINMFNTASIAITVTSTRITAKTQFFSE